MATQQIAVISGEILLMQPQVQEIKISLVNINITHIEQ